MLSGVNIRIKEGEIIYLIGENGAGKSTLLLILAALYVPTSGKAIIFNKELNEQATKDIKLRRRIGIVFQNPDVQLFSPTVFDDVIFAPMHLGTNVNYRKNTENAMRFMNVWHLRTRHPYELSEGEKKRAAIATILSYNPEFMLFDEPTANMDGRGRRDFNTLLRTLKDEGKTVIIATHLLQDIIYATRVIAMNIGQIVYDGSPDILEDKEYLRKINLI